MFAQGGALWTPSGQTATTTTRQVAIKTTTPTADLDVNGTLRVRGMAGFDTSLTAKLITTNAIRVLGLAQLDALLVNGNTQINGMLTVGSFQINNSSIISSTGNILFGNNNLSTTGNVNAANISVMDSTVAIHDSLLTNHQSQLNVHQSEITNHDSAISNILSINNNQEYEIDTLQNEMLNVQYSMLNVQSAISAHDTAIGALHDTLLNLQFQFSNLNSSQWKNDTLNSGNIYYDGGKVGIGTSAPAAKLDVFSSQRITGNLFVGGELSVSDKFSAKTIVTDTIKPTPTGAAVHVAAPMQATAIRVDTLSVSDKFTAENSISSDTLVAVKQLDVNHNLSLGSDSGSAESDIASKASVLTIQSDPAKAYNTAINADNSGKVGIGTRYPTEKLSVDGNVSISGNIQSASINTGSILVSDKFTAPSGAFDTLTVAKEFIAQQRVQSDTLLALRKAYINHNLLLGSDSGSAQSDIASRVDALKIQSEPNATYNVVMSADNTTKVGIGDKFPAEKLSVQGNVKVSGNLTTAGNINANCVTASCFNVSGQTSFDSLQVASKIKTARIVPLDGDSLIHIGDSSIIIDNTNHHVFTATGFDINGNVFSSPDLYFQCLSAPNKMGNVIISSGKSSVGIGTTSPNGKLEVNGNIRINDQYDLLLRNSHHGLGWYGATGINSTKPLFANSDIDGPVLYGFSGGALGSKYFEGDGQGNNIEKEKVAIRWTQNGNVGIGTMNPQAELHVIGKTIIGDQKITTGVHSNY